MSVEDESTEDLDFAPYFTARFLDPLREPGQMRLIEEFRYQVYCVECQFLSASDYPSGREADAFDASSTHYFAANKRDELVGYVRLVTAGTNAGFPFFEHCPDVLPGIELPPPGESAEISRLMVHPAYRRRKGDTLAGVTLLDETLATESERRAKSPQILLSMYRQMYRYSKAHGIRYWYAAMEKFLARSLGMFGFDFKQVGPEVDYYGPVATYVADLLALEQSVAATNPYLLKWMTDPRPEDVHQPAAPVFASRASRA
jgi:N-acyl amino acid synthase of PEP-CTERM/exosortase system